MHIAKVVGNVVSTHKSSLLVGKKLLFVQSIDTKGIPFGPELLAVDGVGAGIGDIVIILAEGRSARQIARASSDVAPIELCIAGIIDSVETKEHTLYNK